MSLTLESCNKRLQFKRQKLNLVLVHQVSYPLDHIANKFLIPLTRVDRDCDRVTLAIRMWAKICAHAIEGWDWLIMFLQDTLLK
jgi:hypothetical protein